VDPVVPGRRYAGRRSARLGKCLAGVVSRLITSGEDSSVKRPYGRPWDLLGDNPCWEQKGDVLRRENRGTQTEDEALEALANTEVLAGKADVSRMRERTRLRRYKRVAFVLGAIALYVLIRILMGHPVHAGFPHIPWNSGMDKFIPAFILVGLLGCVFILPHLGMGRSPHTVYRPSDIETRLKDVRGAGHVTTEVVNTVNLFLGFQTFASQMGGTPRRAILFEGPPGTGKTFMAKAMAGEAGVPFLFAAASQFQSQYYGQTGRKIRTFFKQLRKAARREGGAIGFLEELDAIGGTRHGMGTGRTEGISGVVNELLIQLQSFDEPTRSERFNRWFIDVVNRWLPEQRQITKKPLKQANILVIGATNRASDLDPALLRPGRFDRSISFDPPNREGRKDILGYYLAKKSHDPELDEPDALDRLAAMTTGYTPVMLEHLLDEALVITLRRGGRGMTWQDVADAKIVTELGLSTTASYTEVERRTIATHEAGHATVAFVTGKGRQLDVLSILKRRSALGLLQHSDVEERFLHTKSECNALLQIAMGGMAAEEIYFGDVSSGPSGDLASATELAAKMVGSMGMGNGLVSYEAASYAGPVNVVAKVLSSDQTREEVQQLLLEAKVAAMTTLQQNGHILQALRDGLLERDELVGSEIVDIINKAITEHEHPKGESNGSSPLQIAR
jgi:cell division protease FtsH